MIILTAFHISKYHIRRQIIKNNRLSTAYWNWQEIENTNTGIIPDKRNFTESLSLLYKYNSQSEWHYLDWRI
jgi:hypothetical protein